MSKKTIKIVSSTGNATVSDIEQDAQVPMPEYTIIIDESASFTFDFAHLSMLAFAALDVIHKDTDMLFGEEKDDKNE